jgi:hypothetical protein
MDDIDIEEAFMEIQNLHSSFDDKNPITYQILLTSYKERLNDKQIEHIKSEVERLCERNRKIKEKIMSKIDNDISRMSIDKKIFEEDNHFKQIC